VFVFADFLCESFVFFIFKIIIFQLFLCTVDQLTILATYLILAHNLFSISHLNTSCDCCNIIMEW